MVTIFKTPKSDKPQENPIRRDQPQYPPQIHRPPEPEPSIQQNFTKEIRPYTSAKPMEVNDSLMHKTTILGEGLTFTGEVTGKGSIRVEGQFIGTINIAQEVIIGETGSVEGNIHSKVVSVLGKLKGNISASDKITIDVTGSMIGDIAAPRVVVTEGAVFKGKIDMDTKTSGQQELPGSGMDTRHTQDKAKSPPGPPPKV